jgi:hypothetical protein
LLSVAVSLCFFVCGLFFQRFWRLIRDELFVCFAAAFALLGVSQSLIALAGLPTEERGSLYLIRLAAFAVIIVAILRKNRKSRA